MTRRRRVLAAALTTLTVLAGVSACGDDDFVTRDGAGFALDGEPFRFVGVNLYDAAASDIYACSPDTRLSDSALRETMQYLHDDAGATVVRFWAYQTYTDGGQDFAGVDRVIGAARAAGLRVIPVLEDGPGQCSTGPVDESKARFRGDTWYTDGYRHPYGTASVAYRDYVRRVAAHYRDEPTVLAWMMVNEAETAARTGDDRTVLAGFAKDVATVIRAADPNHLITLGTQGNGAPGASGPDFAAVYAQPELDFAEVHDWAGYGSDTDPLPGRVDGRVPAADSAGCRSRTAKIACSFALAARLGKPLVVGEAGIRATDAPGRARRAGLLRAKIEAAFDAGASGYLLWQLNTRNTDGYALVRGQDDPLTGVLKQSGR